MRRAIRSTAFLATFGVALALAAPAMGWGGVDPSFGQLGLARPDPKLPGYQIQSVARMAVGPDGGIYLLDAATNCGPQGCPWDLYLTRRKPDGRRDGEFAGGHGARFIFAGASAPAGELTTDRHGRVIVAEAEAGGIFLARVNPNGSYDRSFGEGGKISIPCACPGGPPVVRTDRAGRIYLATARVEYPPDYPYDTATSLRVLVARLGPNGQPDPTFGQAGWSETMLSEADGPRQLIVLRDGSLLLSGSYLCCNSSEGMYLLRVQPGGTFDSAFAARAGAELQKLSLDQQSGFTRPVAMLVRPHESVDVFGTTLHDGFVLRFRRDGTLAPGFGRGGMRSLPWAISAAARFEDGRVFVAGYESLSFGLSLFALRANGSLDRSFDRGTPIELRGWNAFGAQLAMQRGRRPLLFESGNRGCRQYCPPEPKLMRFLSPWHRGR